MNFLLAIQLLEIIFKSPNKFLNLSNRFNDSFQTVKEIFYNLHLPFMIHFPIVILFSPYSWYSYFLKNLTIDKIIIYYFLFPLFVYCFLILFLVFFDKLQIYSQIPTVGLKKHYFCSYSSIVVSASMVFFIFHPFVGFIGLIVSFIYSFLISIFLWSKYLNKSIKQLILEAFLTLSFFLFFIFLVVLILNILNSYKELKRFGIL